MVDIVSTPTFVARLDALADSRAQSRIARRIARFEFGVLDDLRPISGRVSEARVDHGPGHRIRFTRRGTEVVVLLCDGDKGSQARATARAQSTVKGI